jgi:hypothetical protein
MGTYYDVEKVEQKGRRISHYPMNKPPTEGFYYRLVAVCDRLIFKLAADVTDPSEYDEFYGQYRRGMLVSFDLYDFSPEPGDAR